MPGESAKTIADLVRSFRQIAAGAGVALDAGALIGFERDKRRVLVLLATALDDGMPIRTPAAAVAEFWRGDHSKHVRALIEATCVPDTLERSRRAGEALASLGNQREGGPSVVDAIVAAVASEVGDRVLTSDPEDLTELAAYFGGLTVLGV